MVDEVTTGRGYQKPHPTNLLSEDVIRLRAWADAVDADVTALQAALAGKAASGHTHSLDDVSGLTGALAAKAAVSHSHAIADLADTSISAAAAGQVLRYSGTGWINSNIAVGDVSTLAATLSSLQAAITTMDDGTY